MGHPACIEWFVGHPVLSGYCVPRCKQKVADAKMRRLENIQRLQQQQEERLDAINEKLAAGIARRNAELRNRKMRSLAACRWCAARKIQVW